MTGHLIRTRKLSALASCGISSLNSFASGTFLSKHRRKLLRINELNGLRVRCSLSPRYELNESNAPETAKPLTRRRYSAFFGLRIKATSPHAHHSCASSATPLFTENSGANAQTGVFAWYFRLHDWIGTGNGTDRPRAEVAWRLFEEEKTE